MRALLLVVAALAAGCLGVADEPFEDGSMPVLPGEEAADAPTDPARTALLERMRARFPEIRRLKADLAVGETHDGWLAERPALVWDDPAYAELARRLVAEDSADRATLYDQEMAKYEADIQAQIQAQLPDIRRQVVEQLCAALPVGTPCEQLATTVIDTALEAALREALAVAVAEVRVAVQRVHAEFWQRKATAPGEWIEREVSPGIFEWRAKPAPV